MQQVLITGASSGIGLATAQTLIDQGEKVVGIARDFSEAQCNQLHKVEIDLSDLQQLSEQLPLHPQLQMNFDTLILNAGYGRFGGLEQFSYQQIQHLVNTNLTSNLFILKHYLPKLKKQGGKDIVIVGSESALRGGKSGTVYCATKFALRGLAQSLRMDCANNDIRVMLINPGPTDTDFFDDSGFQPMPGDEFSLTAQTVADSIIHALSSTRQTVIEEINLQPMKRSFTKK